MSRSHGKPPSQRQLRVGEEIRHALANILERGEVRDPDVAGRPITITEVRISPDLRNATVFFVPLGGGEPGTLTAGLKRVRPYLRHELARAVDLRYVPDLSFAFDESFDRASRIDQLLASPVVRRDIDAAALDETTRRPNPADGQEGDDDGA